MSEATPLPQFESPTSFTHPQQQGQNTVACMICHTVYAPQANQPQLAQASQAVLESAFMGMCHFCFRCRRPSCPFCWDAVHGICGSCVRETGLPFRSDAPPLSGTWLPPMRQGQPATNNGAAYPLVAIQPGHLEGLTGLTGQPGFARQSAPGMSMMPPQMQPQSVPGAFPGVSALSPNAQNVSPVMMPSSMSAALPGISAGAMVPPSPMMAMPSVPVTPDITQQKGAAHSSKRAQSRKAVQEDHLAPYYIYIDDSADVAVDGDEQHTDVSPNVRFTRRFGRVTALPLLIVVALLMIIIIAASFSAGMNSYIAQTMHIDIRAGISSLWQLVTHLLPHH